MVDYEEAWNELKGIVLARRDLRWRHSAELLDVDQALIRQNMLAAAGDELNEVLDDMFVIETGYCDLA